MSQTLSSTSIVSSIWSGIPFAGLVSAAGGESRFVEVVVPVEAERPAAALAEARGDRVEFPARLAEECGGAVGAGENRPRLGVLRAGEEARPGEKVAEDEGGGVRIRAGDVAELGADPAQREERPGALKRVLRLGQPALLERTRESVVLGRGERRERPRSCRRGRGGRPHAGGEQESKCELGEAHWNVVSAGPRDGDARL